MGNTGIPVVDSFRYLAKIIQYCKFKNKIKLKIYINKLINFKKSNSKLKTEIQLLVAIISCYFH